VGNGAGCHDQRPERDHLAGTQADTGEAVIGGLQAAYLAGHDRYVARGQLLGLFAGGAGSRVQHVLPGRRSRLVGNDLASVTGHFPSSGVQQVAGRDTVPQEEPVHMRRRRVAGPTIVDHQHRSSSTAQHKRPAQARRPPPTITTSYRPLCWVIVTTSDTNLSSPMKGFFAKTAKVPAR
jgi:hypothetical protein